MIKQRNLLTPIFETTPCIVMHTKETLMKATAKNSDRIVTRNISHVCRIPKMLFSQIVHLINQTMTLNTRDGNNANYNHNNRRYPLRNS